MNSYSLIFLCGNNNTIKNKFKLQVKKSEIKPKVKNQIFQNNIVEY